MLAFISVLVVLLTASVKKKKKKKKKTDYLIFLVGKMENVLAAYDNRRHPVHMFRYSRQLMYFICHVY